MYFIDESVRSYMKNIAELPLVSRDDEIELANTKHNFFSQHVWNDTMLRVIDKKIRQEEDEIMAIRKIANNLF